MPSKVAAYYTTDMEMRPIWSNNLKSEPLYDSHSMTLYVEFNSGCIAKYYGVPKDLYLNIMKSPSQGTAFYHTIRQRFPFDYIEKKDIPKHLFKGVSTKQPKEDISSILRENKQLDKLDKDEQILNKALDKGQISQAEYNRLMNYIQGEKEKALASLERKGYFEEEEVVNVNSAIDWQVLLNGVIGLFKVAGWMVKGVLQLVGLFFGLMLLLMS